MASPATPETVRFRFSWPIDVADFDKCKFNDRLCSETFKTVHSNLGFEWKVCMEPKGGNWSGNGYREDIGLYIQLCGSNGLLSVVHVIDVLGFVEVGTTMRNLFRLAYESEFVENTVHGVQMFLPQDFDLDLIETETEKETISEILRVGVSVTLPSEVFDLAKILDAEEAKIVRREPQKELFRDVVVTSGMKEKKPSHPPQDEARVLDFQIITSDQKIIWCHKAILAKKNDVFRAMICSPMKEGSHSEVEVDSDSETMLELVHFIYTQEISNRFGSLELGALLNGAEKYGLTGLKLICERNLIQRLDVENAAECLYLGDLYGLKILRESSLNFMSENVRGVRKSSGGKKLKEELWDEVFDVVEKRLRVIKLPKAEQSIYRSTMEQVRGFDRQFSGGLADRVSGPRRSEVERQRDRRPPGHQLNWRSKPLTCGRGD